MSTDADLRANVHRSADPTAALVYADFLDETGRPALARFVRAATRLEGARPAGRDFQRLLDEADRDWVFGGPETAWNPDDAMSQGPAGWSIATRRGLPAWQRFAGYAEFRDSVDEAARDRPGLLARVDGVGVRQLGELLRLPAAPLLGGLHLVPTERTTGRLSRPLLQRGEWLNLGHLHLRDERGHPETLPELARAAALRPVHTLGVSQSPELLAAGIDALGAAEGVRLHRLELRARDTGPDANPPPTPPADLWRGLARGASVAGLRELALSEIDAADDALEDPRVRAWLGRLDRLDVRAVPARVGGMRNLARLARHAPLREMHVRFQDDITDDMIRELVDEWPADGHLETLELWSMRLGPERMRQLARWRGLATVRDLDLSYILPDPEALLLFSQGRHLTSLERIDIRSSSFDLPHMRVLTEGFRDSPLKELWIQMSGGNDRAERAEAFRLFVRSPLARGLHRLVLDEIPDGSDWLRVLADDGDMPELRQLFVFSSHVQPEEMADFLARVAFPKLWRVHAPQAPVGNLVESDCGAIGWTSYRRGIVREAALGDGDPRRSADVGDDAGAGPEPFDLGPEKP